MGDGEDAKRSLRSTSGLKVSDDIIFCPGGEEIVGGAPITATLSHGNLLFILFIC